MQKGITSLQINSYLEQLITIKAFLTPSEASMMKSLLEAEDMYCFLKDENSVVMMPYMANAIGGVKLQVRESDVVKAVEVLKQAGFIKEPQPKRGWFKENKVLIILSLIVLYVFLYYFLPTIPSFKPGK
jgi:type III secretory pathway lipoprotein EscJ